MHLKDAITEFRYSKDWSKQTSNWYESRLTQFVEWCAEQDARDLEQVTPPLVRRYIAYLQARPAKRSEKLDSFTVHGHVRVIRALLFWAASEDLIDEKIPRRIALPKREQKVLQVL
jgi:site-specific recombinase XerD